MTAFSARPVAETMEDRILHSADIAPLMLADAASDTLAQQTLAAPTADLSVQRNEIVFVDAGVPDAASLIADLQAQRSAGRPVEIVLIGAGQDGVALISDTLAGRGDIGAVHVLAHGGDGLLQLGSARLDAQALLQRAGEVAGWSSALGEDADLLLYGCDVAQTALGQHFVQSLAALTGADVAASADLTGAAAQGGNWRLEYTLGAIETALAPSAWAQARWQGVMATYTVTTTADAVGGTLLVGSLRWAISEANANAGTDTIDFAVNGSFNITASVSDDDNNNTGDFDVSDSVNIVGNGAGNTVINGNGVDRVLDLRSGTISLSGLTVQGGASNAGAGIRVENSVQATLSDVVVQNNTGANNGKGAGIYNGGTLVLRRIVVQNNNAVYLGGTDGAGIFNKGSAALDAQDVEIRNNNAGSKDGGGLYLEDAPVTLVNVTLANNVADQGGGLWNKGNSTSLRNVTVSGNWASQGGGLWSDHRLALDHVTVAYNWAWSGVGGGFYIQGSNGPQSTVANSLFAGNAGGNANQAVVSLGYNLSDDNSAGFTGSGDLKNVAASLLSLADNGGFTRTHAIAGTSAAHDAANPVTSLTADQRGVAYFGGRSDIGAFEYNPNGFAPTVSAVADQTIDEGATLGPLAFTIGDVETSAGSLVVTATSSNTGLVPDANLVVGGSGSNRTISLTPAPDANSSANGGPTTITLSVSDGTNITVTTFTVTINAVNDAPTISLPAARTVDEDTTLTLSGASAPSIADVDAGTASLQITLAVAHGLLTLSQTTGLSFVSGTGSNNASMTFAGSLSAINAALDGLQYVPVANYNGPDQIDLNVNDLGNSGSGGARLASGSLAITVSAVNDAPVLGLPGPQATPQGSGLTLSAASGNVIVVSDVDAGPGDLQITLDTGSPAIGTLTLASTAGLSFSVGSGSGDVGMTFTGSVAAINAALDGLVFSPDAAFSGPMTLQIGADDLSNTGSGGARQASGAVAITVTADALPTLTLSQSAWTFTENDAATPLDAALTIDDSDDPELAKATVRIAGGYAGAEDVLGFVNDGATMGNIAGSYAGGVLSLSSAGQTATLAQWQAALRSITYVNTSDAPDTAARTVTLTVNDGIADSAEHSITVNVQALNDAPALAGANNLATIGEDTTVNDGTLVSTLIAGQIGDVDGAAGIGIAVTGVDDSYGNWQYTTDAGATWNALAGVGDDAARLLRADAHTAVRFVPAGDWNGTVTAGLSFRAWDQSSGVAGGTADTRVNGDATAFSVAKASSNITVAPVNDAPALASAIVDQVATQDVVFSFVVPPGAFTDIDAGDTLVYSATLASGAALPAWLSFDAATQTFNGTPANASVGDIVLRVTATDSTGAAASGSFTLRVVNVNDAPVQDLALSDVAATQGIAFSFTIPDDTFTDIDAGDTLVYSATLASGAALPLWLSFDAATQAFSGTPGNADVGALSIRVTATDASGASAYGDFALSVANANDAPVLAAPIADRSVPTQQQVQFQIPAATFSDSDVGDTLRYAATLADGSALPAWLRFDPQTRTFTGAPGESDVGLLQVRVTATDDAGAVAQAAFAITVFVPRSSAPAEPFVAVPPPAVAESPQAEQAEQVDAPAAPLRATAPAPAPAQQLVMLAAEAAPLVQNDLTAAAMAPATPVARRDEVVEVPPGPTSSHSDAVLAVALVHQFNGITLSPMMQMLNSDDMLRKLEEIKRLALEQGEAHRSAVASTVAVTGGLSIGYVVWLVRGGVLVSSMLSTLPAWQMIDPMPVLAAGGAVKGWRTAGETEEPEVERLFDRQAKAAAGRLPGRTTEPPAPAERTRTEPRQ
jgi:VCBS repeat-containing protein